MEHVSMPIDGVLDLHTFNPKEIPDLLVDYLTACREKGIYEIRVIHGKGTGAQKARVRALLAGNPFVRKFRDAPADYGGWGATLVTLIET